MSESFSRFRSKQTCKLVDLTVSMGPGTGFRMEIHFTVFGRFYLLFSFVKLVEASWLCLAEKGGSLPEVWGRSEVYFMGGLVVWVEGWISVRQLVPVLFRVFRLSGEDTKTKTLGQILTRG